MPLGVPRDWAEVPSIGWQGSPTTNKIRSFKRRLYAHLSQYPSSPPGLLERDCDWLALLPQGVASWFVSKLPDGDEIDVALTRIIGKSSRKQFVDFEDIKSILLRVQAPKATTVSKETQGSEEEVNTNDDDAKEAPAATEVDPEEEAKKAREAWDARLAEVKRSTSSLEDELLPCLVDPFTLTTSFDDVILNPDVLASMKTLVRLSKLRPEAASKLLVSQIRITGALLYGPPGTGKTLLARAIAKSTGSNMLVISPAIINAKYVGESETRINAAFSLARKLFPCIIFIDEVDALLYRRDDRDPHWQRAHLTQFLQEMDGLTQDEKAPFVLAATNRPMDIDSAFLRRLPQKIAFGVPDGRARASILRIFLKEDDLDGVDVDRLAAMTDGFSGSDLKTLCGEAGLAWAVEQDLGSSDEGVSLQVRLTDDHFTKALNNVKPSISPRDTKALEEFNQRFGASTRVSAMHSRATNDKKDHVNTARNEPPVQDEEDVSLEADQIKQLFERSFERIFASILASSALGPARQEPSVVGRVVTEDSTLLDDSVSLPEEDLPEVVIPIINPPKGCLEKARLPYDYSPLPTPTSIRLLKLHTLRDLGPEHLRDPLRCSVAIVDLADNPDYFALSYTWGDPRTLYTDQADMFPREAWAAPAFEMECDGRPVSVATNLYTALVALRAGLGSGAYASRNGLGDRYQPHHPDYFYLWVDALCINQDDLDEKSHQVPLMDRIYSKARATLMWLGGGEPLAAQGFAATWKKLDSLAERLEATLDADSGEDLESKCQAFDITDPEAYAALGLEPVKTTELIGWYLYISRSWFKRSWIVQEWVLSSHCVFVCGGMTMQPDTLISKVGDLWTRFWLGQIQSLVRHHLAQPVALDGPARKSDLILENRDLVEPTVHERDGVPLLYRAELDYGITQDVDRSLITIKVLKMVLGHAGSVEYSEEQRQLVAKAVRTQLCLTVHQFRGMQATNPRDKVYSFHGLFKDDTGRSLYPAPDYTKDVREVYTEAAGVLVGEVGISFLTFRETRPDNPHNLPSWAPDFGRDTSGFFVPQHRFYMASAGLRPFQIELRTGDILRVAGCRVDTVAHTQWHYRKEGMRKTSDSYADLLDTLGRLPETSWIAPPPENHDRWPRPADAFPPAYRPSRTTPQSRFEVFWRTCLQDQSNGHHPAPARYGELQAARFQKDLGAQFVHVALLDIYLLLEPFLLLDRLKREAEAEITAREDQIEMRKQLDDPPRLELMREIKDAHQKELTAQRAQTELQGRLEQLGRVKCALQEDGARNDDAFVDQIANDPLAARVWDRLRALHPTDTPMTAEERDAAVAAMLDTQAAFAMLQGGQVFDSAARPPPPFWTRHQALLAEAAAARDLAGLRTALLAVYEHAARNGPDEEAPADASVRPGSRVGRSLFVTAGARLGLSESDDVQAGDEVWLLAGLHVPVALRRAAEGRYGVVGCVYVHGIMHGEGVEEGAEVVELDLV